MALTERALDRVTVTVDMKILDLVKLEALFRGPGMSRTAAMDAAMVELLKNCKETKEMVERAREIYDQNVKRREKRRVAWTLERGALRRRKRENAAPPPPWLSEDPSGN